MVKIIAAARTQLKVVKLASIGPANLLTNMGTHRRASQTWDWMAIFAETLTDPSGSGATQQTQRQGASLASQCLQQLQPRLLLDQLFGYEGQKERIALWCVVTQAVGKMSGGQRMRTTFETLS